MDNVIPIRPQRISDQLAALARRPWASNRELLLDLAARARAIEALLHEGEHHDGQLDLGEAA
jgi:hypothetical protein